MSASDSSLNHISNLLGGTVGCRMGAYLVETLIQSRICNFFPFDAPSQWVLLYWLAVRLSQSIHTNTEPVIM